MNNVLKRIENFEFIEKIYLNQFFHFKDIINELALESKLSETEIEFYNKFYEVQKDISNGIYKQVFLDKQLTQQIEISQKITNFNSVQKFIYGEIDRKGVEKLHSFICEKIDNIEDCVFYDIGSGNGKLILHFSLISDFKKFVGVELDKVRFLYSNIIKQQLYNTDNVIFINDDLKNLDFYDADVIFCNDVMFDESDIEFLVSKIKPGSHLISISNNSLSPDDIIDLNPSWQETPLSFKYYKIK